jgi:hypothetical protein
VSARGEREDVEDGRHESKKKTYSMEYTKGTRGPSTPTKGTVACERGRPTWWRRKREAGGAGWAKRVNGPAGCWAGSWKNPFRINIGFLNLLRLWKFAQEDLWGILTQRFFLNSSRLLKDF